MFHKTLIPVFMSCLLGWCTAPGLWADSAPAASTASAAFETLKQLQGSWTGKNPRGGDVEVDYEVTGGGTVLMERYRMDGHGEMLTVYHLDGESILLTHYCSVGNQPRMRASEFSGDGELRFEFVDVSGLQSGDDGHMHHALVRYQGGDSMTSDWTFRQNGKDQFTESVTIVRAE